MLWIKKIVPGFK